MGKYRKVISLLVLAILAWTILWHQGQIHTESDYVSSNACRGCHREHYKDWSDTLHPRQFRPVSAAEDILGDFDSGDPALSFTKSDVEYVIGNRYEQVYARMLDGEYYPLPAKWYIEERKWVPYKVKDWRETPMSTKCNGCHTTGFDPNTLEFAEYGIGCEACHGPGGVHTQNRRMDESTWCTPCHRAENYSSREDIVSSVNSAVCGQCHSRGVEFKDAEHIRTSFNFPISYQPGQDLPRNFNQSSPDRDKKGKYWWGTGLSKKRHQEFSDFNLSAHSKSLRNLHESHTTLRGEKTDACLRCHSADYRLSSRDHLPDLNTAKYGITCVVCHEPHRLSLQRHQRDHSGEICGQCHADGLSLSSARSGRPHYPCPVNQASCPDCHMPYIVMTGGGYHLRSHAFRIVRPQDTRGLDMPNSCQNGGCHADKSLDWAVQAFTEHYPEVLPDQP